MGSQAHTAFLGAGSGGWQLAGQQGITWPPWSLMSWWRQGREWPGCVWEEQLGGQLREEGAGSSVGRRAALGLSRPRVLVTCVGHLEERKPTKPF